MKSLVDYINEAVNKKYAKDLNPIEDKKILAIFEKIVKDATPDSNKKKKYYVKENLVKNFIDELYSIENPTKVESNFFGLDKDYFIVFQYNEDKNNLKDSFIYIQGQDEVFGPEIGKDWGYSDETFKCSSVLIRNASIIEPSTTGAMRSNSRFEDDTYVWKISKETFEKFGKIWDGRK